MLVQDLDPGLSHIATAITITELHAITNVFISFELKENLKGGIKNVLKKDIVLEIEGMIVTYNYKDGKSDFRHKIILCIR